MKQEKKAILKISFLNLFVREMILSKVNQEKSKEKVEIEKVKRKFFKEIHAEEKSTEEAFKKIINSPIPISPKETPPEERRVIAIHRERIPETMMFQQPRKTEPTRFVEPVQESKKLELIKVNPIVNKQPYSMMNNSQKSIANRVNLNPISTKPNPMLKQIITPMPQQQSGIPSIERLSPIMKDSTVVMIECPGPGKNIIVKKYNQVNVTRIVLTEPEIKSVIDYFSKEARIPLIGGILKAAVGNSIISAIVSEFVGSRFIINKITPYSMITKR